MANLGPKCQQECKFGQNETHDTGWNGVSRN